MNNVPNDLSSNKLPQEYDSTMSFQLAQNASENLGIDAQAKADKTVTEQPTDNQTPNKVDTALETHMNVMPFFAGGMLVLLVAALIMRPGSGKRKAVGNKTVGSAKLLIENGEHDAAIEMLNDHLANNPGDDRAKALLKRATSEN